MAQKNKGSIPQPDELNIQEIEVTAQKTPSAEATEQEPADLPLVYVGPDYNVGIAIYGMRARLIRPANFTQQEIADFLARHPDKAHWWAPAAP